MHLFRHLSGPAVACRLVRPTPRLGRAALRRRYTWSFNPSGVRLPVLPPGPVSFYLTFSPIPRPEARLLFSVTLLYPFGYLPVRKDGALCCPDFPLPVVGPGATDRPARLQRYELFANCDEGGTAEAITAERGILIIAPGVLCGKDTSYLLLQPAAADTMNKNNLAHA